MISVVNIYFKSEINSTRTCVA